MNKQELIRAIIKRDNDTQEALEVILEDMLPDFNPYKIDKERLLAIWIKNIGVLLEEAIKEYNSTLPEGLKPLPKEMPEWFHGGHNFYKLWSLVCHNYGTASNLQPLPSVEELAEEIFEKGKGIEWHWILAKHIHDKYSLKPSEWWQDLKEGDKFKFQGEVLTFERLKHYLFTEDLSPYNFNVQDCTPYTAPTASEIIAKHNLTEEEVKIIKNN